MGGFTDKETKVRVWVGVTDSTETKVRVWLGVTGKEIKVRVWVGVSDYKPYRRPKAGFGWVSLITHHTGDQGQGLGWCH